MPNVAMKRPPRGQHYTEEQLKVQHLKPTLRQLSGYLLQKRWPLAAVFGFTVVTTVVSIIGTRLNGLIIDRYIRTDRLKLLAMVCLLMVGMYVVASGFNWLQSHFMVNIAQETSTRIRQDVFTRMQRLPLSYFDQHPSGDLMSRLTNDVDNINTALMETFIQLFTGVISVVGMLIAMLVLSPALTLVVLLASTGTYFLSRQIAKFTQTAFRQQQAELGQLNSEIEETLSGKKTIQLFEQADQVLTDFRATNQRYVHHAYQAQVFSGALGPLNNMLNNLAYALITVLGALAILHGYQGITVGIMFAFLIYMRDFTGPIRNMLDLINTLQVSIVSAERVFAVINAPAEQDAPHVVMPTLTGTIALQHVTFGYQPEHPILHDISLTAKPGEMVAIVGPTGAGKTTTINLLTKLYPLTAGTILIDGHPIDQLDRYALRRQIAIVQQEPFLFSGTIQANIRLGRLDASEADIVAAAKAANAHDFIMQLPAGYQTQLSDRQQSLSQGQRQLISIARAFLAQTPILILDEATSAIDTKTEMVIQQAMDQLMQQKTSFVIAHRLSTIQKADQIIVIDQGRIVERGTHAHLLAQKGLYWRLYRSQFQGKDV
ncbi:ABC transporter ATP-binding protein [Loigolactobacillus bifermentans]|nr:ABC transporter ATP-binding protein [Loigolactobacillus bifermentans]QGG61130.1 ATP-binding cassette domain-containing protein [Loigolactobacillus bifermentans]